MNREKIITSGQLFVLLFVCKIASVLLYPAAFSGRGSVWELFIPLLICSVLEFLFLIPIIKYKDSGADISKPLSVLYMLYFIFLSVYHIVSLFGFMGEMSGSSINRDTIILFILLVAAYASYKGLESLTRFSGVAFAFIVISAAVMIFFLWQSFDTANLLPVRNNIYSGTALIMSETEELAVLFILCRTAKGRFVRSAVMWNMFQYIFLALMLILISGTMGEYLINMPYPFYHSIDGAGELQRLNPLFIGTAVTSFCCSLSIDLYVILSLLGRFSAENKVVNTAYVPILVLVYAAVLFINNNRSVAEILFNVDLMAILSFAFSVILPMTVLLVYKAGNKKSVRRGLRTASLILCIALIIPTLYGCSAVQLNQRLIVQGIGIDQTDNEYTATFIVLDTESEKENSSKLLYSKGESVEAALSNLENQKGRKILLSQCLFIILNENSADNAENTLAYFRHNNDIMKTTNIMVAENAKSLINTAVEMGYTSENINLVTDSNAVEQPTVHFSLFDYITFMNNDDENMTMPYIETDNRLNLIKISGSYTIYEGVGTVLRHPQSFIVN